MQRLGNNTFNLALLMTPLSGVLGVPQSTNN